MMEVAPWSRTEKGTVDWTRPGAYGKVCRIDEGDFGTGRVCFYIKRRPAKEFKPEGGKVDIDDFDLFFMTVYTTWSASAAEADEVRAFDLFPVVDVDDMAIIALGWSEASEPVAYYEYGH